LTPIVTDGILVLLAKGTLMQTTHTTTLERLRQVTTVCPVLGYGISAFVGIGMDVGPAAREVNGR